MLKSDLNIILVDTNDPNTIAFGDVSNYGNTIIKNPTFEITPPGFPKKNVLFTTNSVNIFAPQDLGLSCEVGSSLPDGIYKIKYSVKPNIQLYTEKSFMNISTILCRLYSFVLSLPQDKLLEVELLLEGAVSAANIGEESLAYELYNQAKKLLDRADQQCENC